MSKPWDFGLARELAMVEERINACIQSDEPLLTDIARYVIGAGGKRIRPMVTLLSFQAAEGTEWQKIIDVAACMELIHSATLIHDDINDVGTLRRGKPPAYVKFGTHEALVAGDFLFVKAFAIGGRYGDEVIRVTEKACTSLAEGEIRQKRNRANVGLEVPEYLAVVERKTASPIAAGAQVGALVGNGTPEQVRALGEYGRNLGIAFQIVDDVLDVVGTPSSLGKSPGSDIREGNVTLLSIHALNDGLAGDREDLVRVLQAKQKSEADVRRAVELILRSGAVERATTDAAAYVTRAKEALRAAIPSAHRKNLEEFADFILTRNN